MQDLWHVVTVKSQESNLVKSFASFLKFRIMPISKLVWDMNSTFVDIETAFIHGDLDDKICMDNNTLTNQTRFGSKQDLPL
jgi:hypothetical protein